MTPPIGLAGRVARAFIDSKLTPLFIASALGLGALALVSTPREEEPQIRVPMVDVMVAWPGAEPAEVETRVVEPIERAMWGLSQVEHVYATARQGSALVTVRFRVGESSEESLVKVYERLSSLGGRLPQDALPPAVELHSIDDVPFLTLTLWGKGWTSDSLRPARGGARPGALRGPRDEQGLPHRRAGASGARRARSRPHGRRRHLVGPPRRGSPVRLGDPERGHERAGQPRDPGGGRSAVQERPGGRAGGRRRAGRTSRVRVDRGPGGGRPGGGEGRRLLFDGPGRRGGSRRIGRRVPRRDDSPCEAARRQRDAPRRRSPRESRPPPTPPPPRRGSRGRDPELRPDCRGQVLGARGSPAHRHAFGGGPHRPRHGLAKRARGSHRRAGDAGPHSRDLRCRGLHAQSRHPLCLDLLDRHPRGRRHRRGREHRAPPPGAARRILAPDCGARRGRGRQSDHPGHVHGHRRDPAHGVRSGPHGSVHASNPHGRLGGHALLPGRGLHRLPLGRVSHLQAPGGARGRGAGGRRDSRRGCIAGPWAPSSASPECAGRSSPASS